MAWCPESLGILSPPEHSRTACSSPGGVVADVTCLGDCHLGQLFESHPLPPLCDLRNRQWAQSCSFTVWQWCPGITDSLVLSPFHPAPCRQGPSPWSISQGRWSLVKTHVSQNTRQRQENEETPNMVRREMLNSCPVITEVSQHMLSVSVKHTHS